MLGQRLQPATGLHAKKIVGGVALMNVHTLGFTLRLVASHQDLLDACAVRAQAYGHHLPEMGQRLAEPDELDFAQGTSVFLCRDKATAQATGTMRIQTSALSPLLMEDSVELPSWLTEASRAEVTRLAVPVGVDPLTRLCLWKASYLFCMAHDLRWMVVGARNEALIRNYRRLGFVDVFRRDELKPLAHTGGVMHSILAFDASAAKREWGRMLHPLYTFMFETEHEDLQLCPALAIAEVQPILSGPQFKPLVAKSAA
jgi:hypothetical protein